MLVATESQKIAIAGAMAEAIVNIGSSIYLARHIGAIGVAFGTLVGAFVSVTVHFAFNMKYTYPKFSISRLQLFLESVLRPGVIAIPSLLLLPRWWTSTAPSLSPSLWIAWGISTVLLAWFVGLNAEERSRLVGLTKSRLRLSTSYS
jgi:hypothetical protein